MDNPEKLATWGTQDDEKHNTICVGHHSVGNDRSPNASGNFGWRVRSALYLPVWRVTVVRGVGT